MEKIHTFRLKVLNDLPNIPIIQLPQTIYFDDESKTAEMHAAIKKQGNYTLLARSQPSYEFAKKVLKHLSTYVQIWLFYWTA